MKNILSIQQRSGVNLKDQDHFLGNRNIQKQNVMAFMSKVHLRDSSLQTNMVVEQTDQLCHHYALLDLGQKSKTNKNCSIKSHKALLWDDWYKRITLYSLILPLLTGSTREVIQQNNDSPVCSILPQLWDISLWFCLSKNKFMVHITTKTFDSQFELGIIPIIHV